MTTDTHFPKPKVGARYLVGGLGGRVLEVSKVTATSIRFGGDDSLWKPAQIRNDTDWRVLMPRGAAARGFRHTPMARLITTEVREEMDLFDRGRRARDVLRLEIKRLEALQSAAFKYDGCFLPALPPLIQEAEQIEARNSAREA